MLILNHALKEYVLDTHRSKPPGETLKSARKAESAAGITRVADITGLDRLGIPVFTSMRPKAEEGAITVYNGKGFTAQEAEVSAIMEGIERYSAEKGSYRIVTGSYAELEKTSHGVLDPTTLILPGARNYSYSEELEWVAGFSIARRTDVLVPAEAVFHPYHRTNQLFRTNTNGLAAGNVMEEAVFHALMELIERDAWSLFEVDASRCRDLEVSASDCGYQPVREILSRLEAASVKAYIKDITSDVGIPTFAAAMDDEVTKDPALLSLGVGTHLVPEIAALRALTEAAQSRLTTIHGTREDTFKAEYARRIGYDRLKRINRRWFAPSEERVRLADLESRASNDFLVDIEYTVKRLGGAGLREVIVVDLTRENVGIPAVRVLVPGLAVYALDKERTGNRLRTAIAGILRKGQ
ncbi:MAG: YcaO-related McrA-glycine thioamidation protein [Candidatus Methanomethylicaceae archaeon]|jgi:ribosomal protein S12 methylthiotransferase accessory factor